MTRLRKSVRRSEAGLGVERELARARFDAPGGNLHVLPEQRRFDVGDRELAGGERGAVDPDAHGVAARRP